MRWLLALLLVLPMAQAVQWEDASDDQEYGRTITYDGNGRTEHWETVGQYGWFPQADVTSASITETAEHIIFEVRFAAYDADPITGAPPSTDNPDEWTYDWTFTYKGERLIAGFEHWGDSPEDAWFHVFDRFEVGDGFISISYRLLWFAETLDDEPGYRAAIPKWLFRDANRVPMREGDVLEDITFAAKDGSWFHQDVVPCVNTAPPQPYQVYGSDCGWRVRDLMQDGAALGDFEVKMTPPGAGHLFMRMDNPIRQSNGLATTYLFEATLHNLEENADDVLVQVAGIPKGWEVYAPAVIAFAGKGQQTIPIAVTVPFEHQHGAERFMELTVASERDPTTALSTRFGVFFADPAQPGGHHDTLYFHTDPDSDYWGWMNTRKDDEEGAHNALTAWRQDFGLETHAGWEIWLSPGLAMGLDFDLAQKGALEFDLEMPMKFDGDVRADLVLWNWDTDAHTLLATGSAPVTADAASPTTVRIDLTPERTADRVPSQPYTNLVLIVNATSMSPGVPISFERGSGPQFHTKDAFMRLPLIDYHDEVDLTGLQAAAFNMESINGTYRQVNPGRTAVVAFNVTNLLETKATIDWELKGVAPFLEWASLGTTSTNLQAGANGTVVVRYTPPASATEEDIAEFVLIGKSREDSNRQVFARLAFFIDTEQDIPDEAAIADGLEADAAKANAQNTKEAPGLPLLAVLAAVAFALRRRS